MAADGILRGGLNYLDVNFSTVELSPRQAL